MLDDALYKVKNRKPVNECSPVLVVMTVIRGRDHQVEDYFQ